MFFPLCVSDDIIGSRNLKKGMIWNKGVELKYF